MKVAVIGCGVMGASIAIDATHSKEIDSVEVYDHSKEARKHIKNSKEFGSSPINIHDTAASSVRNADVVILATPINKFAEVLDDCGSSIKKGAVVTDVGSGKVKSADIISEKVKILKNVAYVPSHPAMGKAGKGPQHAEKDLFKNKPVIVVPDNGTANKKQEEQVKNFWESVCKGSVVEMSSEQHDNLYGNLSHLMNAIGWVEMQTYSQDGFEGKDKEHKKEGNALSDLTRTSQGNNQDMWLPIFSDNKEAILKGGDSFLKELKKFKVLMANKSADKTFVKEVEKVQHFAEAIPDRGRETTVIDTFDTTNDQYVKRFCMPTMIAAAVAGNAKKITDEYNLDAKDVANPSFLDAIRPLRAESANQEKVLLATILQQNSAKIVPVLDAFTNNFEKFMGAVENIEGNGKSYIKKVMTDVSKNRSQMPPSRGAKGSSLKVRDFEQIVKKMER